jgi:phosphoglycerate dehydrogenase-like enzyme
MKIAVLDDYLNAAKPLADWDALGDEVVFFQDVIAAEDCAQALAAFDVIVAMRERTRFPAALIQALPNLKLIVTTGLRNNAIDLPACHANNITVCGAPGDENGAVGTAELAWALALALFKRIPQEARNMQDGLWQTVMTPTLSGKCLGLVGVGKLGQQVAQYGRAFGMDLVAWSPNLTDERAQSIGVRRVDKAALFEQADIVVVNLVLSERTEGVVDAASIAAMKPSAYFVNTSRAGLVDLAALKTALEGGGIAGAGLDVFEVEPLPANDPWRHVPNTVLTPHLGYVSTDNYNAYFPNVVAAIEAFKKGQPIRVIS